MGLLKVGKLVSKRAEKDLEHVLTELAYLLGYLAGC